MKESKRKKNPIQISEDIKKIVTKFSLTVKNFNIGEAINIPMDSTRKDAMMYRRLVGKIIPFRTVKTTYEISIY